MKLKTSNKILPEFNMSSMTDIVFLLLIFFLLTSNVTESLELSLPNAQGKASQVEDITISIDKNADYYIGRTKVDLQSLEAELTRLSQQQQKPTIVLRSEKSIAVEKAVAVLDMANRNGLKVLLAVTRNK